MLTRRLNCLLRRSKYLRKKSSKLYPCSAKLQLPSGNHQIFYKKKLFSQELWFFNPNFYATLCNFKWTIKAFIAWFYFKPKKTQLWLALCLRLYHQIFNILIENLNFWQCSELKQRKIWKVLWFRKNDPNIRIHPEPELPNLPATNPLYPAMNDAVVFKYETGRGKLSPLIKFLKNCHFYSH